MARPSALSLSTLVTTLGAEPQTPSHLVRRLGVSRSTIHRCLTKLVEHGIVERVGAGPSAGYRVPTPIEIADRHQQSIRGESALCMDLKIRAAQDLLTALNLVTRLGIGQIEEVSHELRMRAFGAEKCYELSQVEVAEQLLVELKHRLVGMPSNASHGIYSALIDPRVRTGWAVYRAIRHRLAWDRTPQGGMGVDFDEPITGDHLPGMNVMKIIVGESPRISVEMPAGSIRVLGDAVAFCGRILGGDLCAIVDLARDGYIRDANGQTPSGERLSICQAQATGIGRVLHPMGEAPRSALVTRLVELAAKIKVAGVGEMTSDAEVAFRVPGGIGSMPWAGPTTLPAGYALIHSRSMFRVVGPSSDVETLMQVSESASAQTAMQMAMNSIDGQPARMWRM